MLNQHETDDLTTFDCYFLGTPSSSLLDKLLVLLILKIHRIILCLEKILFSTTIFVAMNIFCELHQRAEHFQQYQR